jgi:hypothetical protein
MMQAAISQATSTTEVKTSRKQSVIVCIYQTDGNCHHSSQALLQQKKSYNGCDITTTNRA